MFSISNEVRVQGIVFGILTESEENMFVYRTYVQVVYLTFDIKPNILAFKPDALSFQRWLIFWYSTAK